MYHAGSFIKGRSPVYHLDPRFKLAATVCLSVLILWLNPQTVFIAGLVLLCCTVAGRISLRMIGEAVRPLLFFIILILAVHVFFDERGSFAGLQEGTVVVWRFLCLLLTAVLLTMTTAPSQIIAAIKYFLKPFKKLNVPVDDIAVMILLALRFMPILLAQKERIEQARLARGYHIRKAGIVVQVQSFLSLAQKILFGVFRRADELALAMEARDYQRGDRTSFVELKFSFPDYLAFSGFGFFLVIFVALNSYFG